MSTEKNLNNLVINKVESQDVYDYMKANSLINADELYLVEGNNEINIEEATETESGLMSATDKVKLNGIEENANNYTHPSYTARNEGLYKVTVDTTGHVSDAVEVTKDDITALGIPAQDTTYSEATTTSAGLMSATDKSRLDGLVATGGEANQNAFSNVAVGSVTVTADNATDTLTLESGDNVVIVADTTNDKITISAVDTTYSEAGTNLGLVKTGGDVTITDGVISVNDDSHNHTIANVDGLQAELDSKVDKVDGKGLSTNDLTDTLKSNYDAAYTHSQQAHAPVDAEKNVIVGIQKNGTDLTVNSSTRKVNITVPTKTSELTNDSNFATTTDLDAKVDKIDGKGLSTNDYTTEEKTKLANIEDGANKTVVDTALSSTSTNPVQNKVINTKFTSVQADIDSKVPSTRTVNGKALTANITLSASDVGALPNTTQIPSIDGLATETYVDNKVAGLVDSAPAALDTLNELAAALGDDPNFATTVATQIGTKVDKVEGKGLSTNDYTTDEKTKLVSIESGAQVNQNAFSNVIVESTTLSADNTTDTLTLVAGDNVTLIPDDANDKITIAAVDTVYTHPTHTARIGEPTGAQTPGFGEKFNVSQVTSNSLGHIINMVTRTVTIPDATATTSDAGLMSTDDKIKLDNIEDEANKTIVDSVLSDTSENPVQNKVVNAAITEHTNNVSNPHGVTASQVGALPVNGTAASATKLATARSITVDLSSETAATFNGSTDIAPGVSNILRVTHGGTGRDSVPSGNYLLGNLTGAFISKTPTEVLSDIKAVGYGAAQNLTDAQKVLARSNINAQEEICSIELGSNVYSGTLTTTSSGDNVSGNLNIIEGQTYKVTYNDNVEYIVAATNNGNVRISGENIYIRNNGDGTFYIATRIDGTYTISIEEATITQIDKVYLPYISGDYVIEINVLDYLLEQDSATIIDFYNKTVAAINEGRRLLLSQSNGYAEFIYFLAENDTLTLCYKHYGYPNQERIVVNTVTSTGEVSSITDICLQADNKTDNMTLTVGRDGYGKLYAETPSVIIEQNKGEEQKFWRGTQEEFDAIATKDDATMYIITDGDGTATTSTYMSSTIYDPNGHNQDIFAYVDSSIQAAISDSWGASY